MTAAPRRGTIPTSRDAQLERLLAATVRAGLTVYGVTIEPRRITIATQPIGESPAPAEDAAERWLRANGQGEAPQGA